MTMRKLTLASAALLLGLLALAGTATAGDVGGALKYVPADFTTVVAIDVDAVRTSPLFDALMKTAQDGGDLQAMKQQFGFDATKDLATFVLAGPDELMKREEQVVAIFGGRFDAKRLASFIESQGDKAQKKQVGDATVYTVDGEFAIAIDGTFVIGGAAALVDKALAAKTGKNVTQGKLGSLIKKVQGKKGGFAVIGASKKVKDKLGKELQDLADLESAGVSFDVKGGIAVTLYATFASPKAASAVVDGIREVTKELTQDPDMKELGIADAVSHATMKAEGKTAEFGVKLDDAAAKKLLGALSGGK